MNGEPYTVFVGGSCPPSDENAFDSWGAHVGLSLLDLHRLRHIRWHLERDLGASLSLTDALACLIAAAYDGSRRELARHNGGDRTESW